MISPCQPLRIRITTLLVKKSRQVLKRIFDSLMERKEFNFIRLSTKMCPILIRRTKFSDVLTIDMDRYSWFEHVYSEWESKQMNLIARPWNVNWKEVSRIRLKYVGPLGPRLFTQKCTWNRFFSSEKKFCRLSPTQTPARHLFWLLFRARKPFTGRLHLAMRLSPRAIRHFPSEKKAKIPSTRIEMRHVFPSLLDCKVIVERALQLSQFLYRN